MSNLIRHTHSSGAHATEFERWTADSNLITFTDADTFPALDGWLVLQELTCAQVYNTNVYELLGHETAQIREGLDAYFVVLHHKFTRKTLLSGVAHFPIRRLRDLWPVSRGILREQSRLKEQFQCDSVIFTADWGFNIKRHVLRWGFALLFPKMQVTFKPPMPKTGTNASQVSDFALVENTMSIVQGPRILRRSGTRHAFRQVLAFRHSA